MGLYAEIKEDFSNAYKNDPALNSKLDFLFNYPGVWAVAWYRVAHKLYISNFKSLARIVMGLTQILTNIDIHPGAKIGKRVFIDHGTGVVIGQTAIIEDDVLIYQGVTLGGVSLTQGKRHPTVKKGAVLGAGAKVLGNITIGEYAKIGANSVVVKAVPNNATAIGIPAHVIEKGRCKDPLMHNMLPDINKEMFEYMLKRVAVLEHILVEDNKQLLEQDLELEKIYESFIKAMKN
ncbi:MAG: serine O-acetyltransferase [Sulfurimonas sp. RIFOXYD12_FULL_33_39]|uniref:serine O-acetyltransferase n=1 Tax=unclassified Sulfurimonas TaxID=2623549 RepID=UPI0008AC3289|nr:MULTISPECIES: serine O-acetyltransferase [unclassified Sulfurimonas]OHE01532.1 MAG: serine O-acetyltransferase [Sulfurimonas sp. RIFCSPLOWO2_12_FULL_34_6]OHE09327.1 MAG: serine O-acetyltransferase [Sulfurimonas sp. RIFOXYD12_FULL_33_39]OHE12890.1 MAG: serine O-acetyltransferase [Sulfurimonas sp. RIFOXYD2_FULL_34_21]DAB27300.1 MAG TPA: serine O-acetyltransferase [Sulfurimonas sp. UBA10385]